ncbi:MAG: hypothetical protein IPL61_20415 [Myxococcales bacterium]|nr:hypothetical protein [Myxococcales bacterium]
MRSYDGVPLWGAGVGVGRGPLALGVHAAATSVTHRIGQATPWLVGVDLAVTVACAQGRPITCVGARVDVSRQTVAATSSDPAVMATSIATTAVHGAAELSFTLPIARAEVTATVAVGGGSGLVARANSTPLVSLAGWTVGGAVEVRR